MGARGVLSHNKFTVKIHSISIELKETKTAAADEVKQVMKGAADN